MKYSLYFLFEKNNFAYWTIKQQKVLIFHFVPYKEERLFYKLTLFLVFNSNYKQKLILNKSFV